MLKANNKNTKKRCEICLKLRIKTPEWRQLVVLVFLFLIWKYFTPSSSLSIVDLEQANIGWEEIKLGECFMLSFTLKILSIDPILVWKFKQKFKQNIPLQPCNLSLDKFSQEWHSIDYWYLYNFSNIILFLCVWTINAQQYFCGTYISDWKSPRKQSSRCVL